MAKFEYTGDEHKIVIIFNNSHAKNHYHKKIRQMLKEGHDLDEN